MPNKIKPIRKIPTVPMEATEGLACRQLEKSRVARSRTWWSHRSSLDSGPRSRAGGLGGARALFACDSALNPTGRGTAT